MTLISNIGAWDLVLQIFRIEPKIRGLDLPQKEPESLEEGERSVKKNSEKLTITYGTNKSIREVRAQISI